MHFIVQQYCTSIVGMTVKSERVFGSTSSTCGTQRGSLAAVTIHFFLGLGQAAIPITLHRDALEVSAKSYEVILPENAITYSLQGVYFP